MSGAVRNEYAGCPICSATAEKKALKAASDGLVFSCLDMGRMGGLFDARDVVEAEMARVCNEYAKQDNMAAATAVHDAWLCVEAVLADLATRDQLRKMGIEA